MEPYVLHWLDSIEHEYHNNHQQKKTDYVYFVSKTNKQSDHPYPQLDRTKVGTLAPELIDETTAKIPLLAEEEVQDIKRMINYLSWYPRQLLGDIFQATITPSSSQQAPPPPPPSSSLSSSSLLAASHYDLSQASPLHLRNSNSSTISRLSILDMQRTSLNEPPSLFIHLNRRITADIELDKLLGEALNSKGLADIFNEPDLAAKYLHKQRKYQKG